LEFFSKITLEPKAMKRFTPLGQNPPAAAKDVDKMCEFVEELLVKWKRALPVETQKTYTSTSSQFGSGCHSGCRSSGCAGQSGALRFCYASYEWRSEFGGEVMELVEMYVEQFARSAGVGRTLLNNLIVRGRERGIHRFSCQVHPGNSAIERTLESCGLDPERRTVWSLNFLIQDFASNASLSASIHAGTYIF
jgi:hypothetical protein